MFRQFILITCLFVLSGCAQYGPEELDRLTKEDPVFKQMITARDQGHAQIQAIKNDLLAKKKAVDAQTAKLHADYDAYAKAQNLKAEKFRTAIEANRNLLKRQIETSQAQLRAKEEELKGLRETQEDVQSMQKDKEIGLSAAEKKKWEERSLMLSEKIRPLEEEIQELQIRIRLDKRKVSFLN